MIQAILFPTSDFTVKTANKWLKEHGHTKMKPFHKTAGYLRARITEPDPKKRYYSVTLPNGIIIVNYE